MEIRKGEICLIVSIAEKNILTFVHCLLFFSTYPRVSDLKSRLDTKTNQVLEEKKKRRAQVAKEVAKRHLVESAVDDLYDWIDELHLEINSQKESTRLARKDVKSATRLKNKQQSIAAKRLSMLKGLKCSLREAKDMLADESHEREALERMQTIKLEIKRQRSVGRRGGSGKWPVHIVLLICELLVNGTQPSAVPANIQTASAAFTGGRGE